MSKLSPVTGISFFTELMTIRGQKDLDLSIKNLGIFHQTPKKTIILRKTIIKQWEKK